MKYNLKPTPYKGEEKPVIDMQHGKLFNKGGVWYEVDGIEDVPQEIRKELNSLIRKLFDIDKNWELALKIDVKS